MTRFWRNGLLLTAVSLAGCRTVSVHSPLASVEASIPTQPSVLPAAAVTPLEPDVSKLPKWSGPANAALPPVSPSAPLTPATVQRLATERAAAAQLFELEAAGRSETLAEVRMQLASDSRQRAAVEALQEFYRLAELTGRQELLRTSLDRLDELRESAKKAKANGARLPIELDELDVQRANLLSLFGQAELGAELLDLDLKRRLGLPSKSTARLRPSDDFTVTADALDVEAAVKIALVSLPELLALRTAYHGLTPENLPSLRSYLATAGLPGIGGDALKIPGGRAVRRRLDEWTANLESGAAAEVAVRRKQLYHVIEEKERGAADEVRAAGASLMEQTRQVQSTAWRAEQQKAKFEDLQKMAKGPFLEVPAELEWLRARSDLLAAVMQWQQARVKWLAAQGK